MLLHSYRTRLTGTIPLREMENFIVPAARFKRAEMLQRGNSLLSEGAFDQVIDEMTSVLSDVEDFAEGHYFVGFAEMSKGNLGLAASAFNRALARQPNLIAAYSHLLPILKRAGKTAEIEAVVAKLLAAPAQGHRVERLRGQWLHFLGKSTDAKHHFELGINDSSDQADLHLHLALVETGLGNSKSAERAFKRALILQPTQAQIYAQLARSLDSAGQLETAARVYAQGIVLGDLKNCAYALSRILQRLNRFDESVAIAQKHDIDKLHFRSGVTLGHMDRGDTADLDAYTFSDAENTVSAPEFDADKSGKPAKSKDKWHFKSRTIDFFPRKTSDFDDLKTMMRKFILHRLVPDSPIFGSDATLLTMGSCFAAHLRKRLLARGKQSDTISVPEGLNNSFAVRQFIEWGLTGDIGSASYWYDADEDGGVDHWTPPSEHTFYKEQFKTFDGLVITLGLAEVWRDRETGGVFWRGVPQKIYEAERHVFQISTVEENVENMRAIIQTVHSELGPKPIIFTLSPVPLIATHRTDVNCMVADSVSKSILRVAIDQVMREGHENVYYWPSFEVVRWASGHAKYAAFGDDDGQPRHVNERHVDTIIEAFVECFFAGDAPA